MIRLIRAICLTLILAAFSLIGNSQALQSINDGVYSAQQVDRAERTYRDQCAVCHGDALQGASTGSPLIGDVFLSTWGGRPLLELVNKIQNTMPFTKPGSLSRPQAMDLTALILSKGKFPSGKADLTEAALTRITLPAGNKPSSVPDGNLAELMRGIAFPNSNIIFNLQENNPSDEPPKEMPVPFDYVKWGDTIYVGWLKVDQAAVALTETAPLLLTPGRRCQNGKPVPVDREDWKKYVSDLTGVGKVLYQASKARDYARLQKLAETLNTACANCHKVYRDRGGIEGSGENRCSAE